MRGVSCRRCRNRWVFLRPSTELTFRNVPFSQSFPKFRPGGLILPDTRKLYSPRYFRIQIIYVLAFAKRYCRLAFKFICGVIKRPRRSKFLSLVVNFCENGLPWWQFQGNSLLMISRRYFFWTVRMGRREFILPFFNALFHGHI